MMQRNRTGIFAFLVAGTRPEVNLRGRMPAAETW
jgi:hypothetical protein